MEDISATEATKLVAKKLGHAFERPELLDTALTHSSWTNEFGTGQTHNERQEFLGDAVLELCVSWELFRRFPAAREGELTKLRSRLVNTTSLAAAARDLGLDAVLKLGRGEEGQGGRNRDTVLSDLIEAVLAAIFEDGGFAAAQKAVARLFEQRELEAAVDTLAPGDYKTRLQVASQRLFKDRPQYTLLSCSGPEHAKVFTVMLRLPDTSEFTGNGPSCKKAEQEAARLALTALTAVAASGDAHPTARS